MPLCCRRRPTILSAIAEKLKRRSKDDFKGRHFEASLIVQAVSWYLCYPLSYQDIEELFLERGLGVDHTTLNRWVLAYAPLLERREVVGQVQSGDKAGILGHWGAYDSPIDWMVCCG